MPLVRLRGRAVALAFGSLMLGACAAVPPPVFTPPPETSPAAAVVPRDEAQAGPGVSGRLLTADGRPLITGAIVLSPLDGEAPPPSAPEDVYLSGVPVTIRGTETRQVDLRLAASDDRIAAARR